MVPYIATYFTKRPKAGSFLLGKKGDLQIFTSLYNNMVPVQPCSLYRIFTHVNPGFSKKSKRGINQNNRLPCVAFYGSVQNSEVVFASTIGFFLRFYSLGMNKVSPWSPIRP